MSPGGAAADAAAAARCLTHTPEDATRCLAPLHVRARGGEPQVRGRAKLIARGFAGPKRPPPASTAAVRGGAASVAPGPPAPGPTPRSARAAPRRAAPRLGRRHGGVA